MRERLLIPFVWVVVAVAIMVGVNSITSRADSAYVTAQGLNQATHHFCERVNDGRRDIAELRANLATLVVVTLRHGLPARLETVFHEQLRKLNKPVAYLNCGAFK